MEEGMVAANICMKNIFHYIDYTQFIIMKVCGFVRTVTVISYERKGQSYEKELYPNGFVSHEPRSFVRRNKALTPM